MQRKKSPKNSRKKAFFSSSGENLTLKERFLASKGRLPLKIKEDKEGSKASQISEKEAVSLEALVGSYPEQGEKGAEDIEEDEFPKGENPFENAMGFYPAAQDNPAIMLEGSSTSIPIDLSSSDTHSDWSEGERKSVKIQKGKRLDKRALDEHHTVIGVQHKDRMVFYALTGTLYDQEEVDALRTQALLFYEVGQKIVLGQGNFGKVRLVRNEDGRFLAVKKIADPEGFKNEYVFLKMMEKEKIQNIFPVIDTIIMPSSRKVQTIYQIMPIANLGSGKDLLKHWHLFKPKEREIIVRYLMKTFVDIFSALEDKHIYHTDFKMDNFLLHIDRQKMSVYLSDFGAAVHMSKKKDLPNLVVSPKSDALYFSPEKLTNEHGIPRLMDVYRMQEAWRFGLTKLIYLNPPLGFKYLAKARSLVEKRANYQQWLKSFGKLHAELKEELKDSYYSKEICDAVIALLEPDWKNRWSIKQVKANLKKLEPVDEEELKRIFAKFLRFKSKKSLDAFESKKEKRKGLKEVKKAEKEAKKKSGLNVGLFPPRSKSEEHLPMIRALSFTRLKRTASDLLQKKSPRKEGGEVKTHSPRSPYTLHPPSSHDGRMPSPLAREGHSPRKGGSEIKGHSPRNEGSGIKPHSPRAGLKFHDHAKRKSTKSPSVSPPHKTKKKGM